MAQHIRNTNHPIKRAILDNRHSRLVAFIAILGIGGWIGWTMATTPPPKPIEDITSEIENKETESKEPAKP
jgi:predicted DNA-binding transcriptional regulator